MDIKERILTAARELFMRYGCKSVTMDDIARHLAVSKKTIYQLYQDKDEIVNTFARTHLGCEQDYMQAVIQAAADPVDEIMLISQHVRQMFVQMNPALLFDLRKYHARAWQMYLDHKQNFIASNVRRNLQQGVREGLYRADIDVEAFTRLRLEQIQLIFNPDLFPPTEFNFSEVHTQFTEHFMRGLVTERGLALFNQYKTKYKTVSI